MSRISLFLFITLLSVCSASAQETNLIKVLDSKTGDPIAQVQVSCGDKNLGHTNSKGFIHLKKCPDSFKFHHLAYHPKTLTSLGETDSVFLKKKVQYLNKVVISNTCKLENFGYHNYRKPFFFPHSVSVNPQLSPGVYIPNDKGFKSRSIKNVLAYIQNKGDPARIRIKIYRIKKDGGDGFRIGKELTKNDSLIFSIDKRNELKKFDVSRFHYPFPKTGIYVQFLFVSQKNRDSSKEYPDIYIVLAFTEEGEKVEHFAWHWSNKSRNEVPKQLRDSNANLMSNHFDNEVLKIGIQTCRPKIKAQE